MRILVCGGRNFGRVVRTKPTLAEESSEVLARLEEYKFIQDELENIVIRLSTNYCPNDNWLPSDITIIEGGATGVDSAAADFATVNFCNLEVYPADWKQHGRSGGYIRNKQMLFEGKPDLVVAFPGGKGTAMMVDLANRAGIKVIDMGAKGSQTMTGFSPLDIAEKTKDSAASLQTARFAKIYFQRIAELGHCSRIEKYTILMDTMRKEREWLENMGSEYDDIMQAQEIMASRDEVKT